MLACLCPIRRERVLRPLFINIAQQCYTMAESADETRSARQEKKQQAGVSIAEPLFFWIIVLVLALVLRIVLSNTSIFAHGTQAYGIADSASNFFLFDAGSLILPLIVGAAIGAEIGLRSARLKKALRFGLLNGAYAAIVYIIAIFIIYEVILYVTPQAGLTAGFLVTYLIAPQVVVLLAVTEVFAALSHLRKVGA